MSYGDIKELTSLESLVEEAVPDLPGCNPLVLRKKLQHIARQFCKDTGALSAIIGPFDFEASTATYSLEAPVLAKITAIHRVWEGDVELHKSSYKYVASLDGDVLITFSWTPCQDKTDAWTADVMMVPEMGCEEFPIAFLSDWGDAILAGAVSELCAEQNRKYSNPTKANIKAQEYYRAKQDAQIRRRQGLHADGRLSFNSDDSFAGDFS